MIEKGFTVLVGDANGADKAIQRHLAERAYQNVIVYCMAGRCRNNLGAWQIHKVEAPDGTNGFAYYSAKDLAMVSDADYGLMLWDGASKGTFNDIVQMVRKGKPVVVYLARQKNCESLRSASDLAQLLAKSDPVAARKFQEQLRMLGDAGRAPAAR